MSGPPQTTIVRCSQLASDQGMAAEGAALLQMGSFSSEKT